MKIAVGLSGGVDSSVTAWLLAREGHQVTGITMKLVPGPGPEEEAAAVAEYLKIPHQVIDLSDLYRKKIIQYIQDDYSTGRTPNPCVYCNRQIKFGLFWDRAREAGLDFDYFATGHYAIIEKDGSSGRYCLKKGTHAEKDQAYFLSLLTQEQLSRTLFPLGKFSKPEVRKKAEEAGLFNFRKGESQDLCIGNYREYINIQSREGDFITVDGKVVGRHKGIEHYTIGQRRGLGIGAGYPLYVKAIDKENNRVIVSSDEELFSRKMRISRINWVSVKEPALPFIGEAKIRYADKGAPAVLTELNEDGSGNIEFSQPRRAITPGQLAVFYNEESVSFAGIIEGTL